MLSEVSINEKISFVIVGCLGQDMNKRLKL